MPNIKRQDRSLPERLKQVLDSPLFALINVFGKRDEADGARVAGYRLVRGDDGRLYGVRESPDD